MSKPYSHQRTCQNYGLNWHKTDRLPDWYELSEHGEIVISPKSHNRHQLLCSQIAHQLQTQLGGKQEQR